MSNNPTTPYLQAFEARQAERKNEPAWLADLRRRAHESFGERGFPSTKEEEWRFTNVAPLVRASFCEPSSHNSLSRGEAAALSYQDTARIVFVNGRYSESLSDLGSLPRGVRVASLAAVLANEPERVEGKLGSRVALGHPFAALNSSLFADGAVVDTAPGTVCEVPLHVLYVTTADGSASVAYPRNVISAGEGSQLTMVESYVGPQASGYFNCVVSEYFGAPGSVVDHYKLQNESRRAFHMAVAQVVLERDAHFSSHALAWGGGLVRQDTNAILDAEGIDCILNGLYVISGDQHLDNHMRVEHVKPHCDSHELYKGILDGKARAVFNGLIYVHAGAQKTDAKQTNRNLLLSEDALVNSNPQLEIFADDVRCTHGSTVGQLDEEAVFYLRSRGIEEEAARSLLTYAFASDIVNRIKVDPVRLQLEEFLFGRLASGEIVRQAV